MFISGGQRYFVLFVSSLKIWCSADHDELEPLWFSPSERFRAERCGAEKLPRCCRGDTWDGDRPTGLRDDILQAGQIHMDIYLECSGFTPSV